MGMVICSIHFVPVDGQYSKQFARQISTKRVSEQTKAPKRSAGKSHAHKKGWETCWENERLQGGQSPRCDEKARKQKMKVINLVNARRFDADN